MKPTQNRSRYDPHLSREMMADHQRGREPGRRGRPARPKGRVRTAAVVMESPGTNRPPQMRLAERNEEVQTLPAERPQESLTVCICHRRLDGRSEDPDTHGRHSRIQPWRIDAVPVMEDESVAVGCGEDLPELLESPRGGRVGGRIVVAQPAAADFECGKDLAGCGTSP